MRIKSRSDATDTIETVVQRLFDEQGITKGKGPEFWRFPHDVALHVMVALDQAGYQVVRKPKSTT